MLYVPLGVALIVVGSFLDVPVMALFGIVLVALEAARQPWTRRGLEGVQYVRRMPRRRAVVGDVIPLDVEIWNRKALPLAWIRADDDASSGVVIRERALAEVDDAEGGASTRFRNAWTLAPYERVVRHYHVVAERRGTYRLGPTSIEVGDLFARSAATCQVETVDRWLVRPRSVPVRAADRERHWGGDLAARRGLVDDPTRYAGIRTYQPGDPLRVVHWKAVARLGYPVSKRFDPARRREIVLALDVETQSRPRWTASRDDDSLEDLCVAAASLVRRLVDDGSSVGLAAQASAGPTGRMAYVPPGESAAQLGQCLDLLARVEPYPALTFERLLTVLARTVRPGTSILVLSARDPLPYLATLRRVGRLGFPVRHVAFGPDGPRLAARAREAGIVAVPAALDGPWRTATALRVAG